MTADKAPTPRVDAAMYALPFDTKDDAVGLVVTADFARKLEKELAEANEMYQVRVHEHAKLALYLDDTLAELAACRVDRELLDYLLNADSSTQAQILYAGAGTDDRAGASRSRIEECIKFDAAIDMAQGVKP